ncbi:hypothetical protein [Micromonospora tulbaghiae]|uniref:hypothetical protein n=1 Tax=Micromonospora tulbaghiae TaxID=479978 RepID=UPI0033E4720C
MRTPAPWSTKKGRAGCLFDATADLLRTNPNPADLFDRFIGWTARLLVLCR